MPHIYEIQPEVVSQLNRQRLISVILAVIISILSCSLLGLIFGLLKILIVSTTVEPMISYQQESAITESVIEPKKVVSSVLKKPASPSSSAVTIITANAPADISLPTPEVEIDALSLEFGETEGFGEGWGQGKEFDSQIEEGSFSLFGKMGGGGGLKGHLYDFKQTKRKKATEVQSAPAFKAAFKAIVVSKYDKKGIFIITIECV